MKHFLFFALGFFSLLSAAEARTATRHHRAAWSQRMGMLLRDSPRGVVVQKIRPTSYAQVIAPRRGGLRVGDLIGEVNGVKVRTVKQFEGTCAWYARYRPRRWFFKVRRGRDTFAATNDPRYPCNPLTLIGCGPLP
ncbi:MAG: PDZ domain-containing protein [Bdellovibrionales bacterium]|nr:PDZ domain-containing protein [Bdellovibrionales bacterium]